MDKQSEFIGGADEIFRGDSAVETHQIEAVFLCLTDVIAVAFVIAFTGEIGVVMGDDAPDVAAENKRFAIDKDRGVANGFKFIESENFRFDAVGMEGVKHRSIRRPVLQISGSEGVADNAVFESFLSQQYQRDNFTGSGGNSAVFKTFITVTVEQICGTRTVKIDIVFLHLAILI